MRDPLRRLQRQFEALGRRLAPPVENLLVRRAVERVVDLDGRKPLRVVRQHLRRRTASRDRRSPSIRDSCSRTCLPRLPFVAPQADHETPRHRDTAGYSEHCLLSVPRCLGGSWLVKVATVYGMTLISRALIAVVVLAAACSRTPPVKEYQLKGQILDVKPDTGEVLVKHEDIPGFMMAMTMPYKGRREDPRRQAAWRSHYGHARRRRDGGAPVGRSRKRDMRRSRMRPDPRLPRQACSRPATPCPTRTSWTKTTPRGRSPRSRATAWRDVHVHALPAARLLPAHGSQLHGGSEPDQEDTRPWRRAARVDQLRPRQRHAGGAEGACEDAPGGSRRCGISSPRARTTSSRSPRSSASRRQPSDEGPTRDHRTT